MRKNNIVQDIIETGSEITGSIGGSVIGGLIAGPIGMVIGGASGPIITKVFKSLGSEVKSRILSPREEVRIGAIYTFAIDKILKNEQNGKDVRQDSFFTSEPDMRSASEEVFEGVILKAQKEYEENKIKYYGNLLGNIACDENINKEFAHQLIKLSESLSYNQLCLLKVLNSANNLNEMNLRNRNYRDHKFSRQIVTLLYDLIDLENRHLIVNSKTHVLGITDIVPAEFSTQGNGNALLSLMELHQIPDEHCSEIKKLLSE